jgi:hypothetical protein
MVHKTIVSMLSRFQNSLFVCLFVCLWCNSPQWGRTSSFTRFLDHTQQRTTVGRTPLDKWSARRRDLYPTTLNTHNRQTSMPPVAFESTMSAARADAHLHLRPRGHWDRPFSEEYNSDIVYPVDNSPILVTCFRSPFVSCPHTTDTGLHPFGHWNKMQPHKTYKTHNKTQ